MNQPSSWDPYGPDDTRRYQGQPAYEAQPYQRESAHQRQPAYQGMPQYEAFPDQQPYPGDSNGPRPTRRRKRRWVRYVVTGAVVVVVGIIAAVAIRWAANGGPTAPTGQAAVTSPSSAPKAAPPADLAGIGSVLVLAGDRKGEKVTVTLVRVFGHAQLATHFDSLQRGYRLYVVQFRLHDIGTIAYSGSPSKDAVVVDSVGASYQPSPDEVTECRAFPHTEKIAEGGFRLGCIVFEVPATASITEVWFTLASGKGAQTGRWEIRGYAN
jgi:hypothetical protein